MFFCVNLLSDSNISYSQVYKGQGDNTELSLGNFEYLKTKYE